jgi:hypothetical protein
VPNPGSEGALATPDPSTPASPEENIAEPGNTDYSTETSPDAPASPEDTPTNVEDLPPGEGSDTELDSPED